MLMQNGLDFWDTEAVMGRDEFLQRSGQALGTLSVLNLLARNALGDEKGTEQKGPVIPERTATTLKMWYGMNNGFDPHHPEIKHPNNYYLKAFYNGVEDHEKRILRERSFRRRQKLHRLFNGYLAQSAPTLPSPLPRKLQEFLHDREPETGQTIGHVFDVSGNRDQQKIVSHKGPDAFPIDTILAHLPFEALQLLNANQTEITLHPDAMEALRATKFTITRNSNRVCDVLANVLNATDVVAIPTFERGSGSALSHLKVVPSIPGTDTVQYASYYKGERGFLLGNGVWVLRCPENNPLIEANADKEDEASHRRVPLTSARDGDVLFNPETQSYTEWDGREEQWTVIDEKKAMIRRGELRILCVEKKEVQIPLRIRAFPRNLK